MGRNLRREAQIALEGILIGSNARSPKRARKPRAFCLTLTYMDVGSPHNPRPLCTEKKVAASVAREKLVCPHEQHFARSTVRFSHHTPSGCFRRLCLHSLLTQIDRQVANSRMGGTLRSVSALSSQIHLPGWAKCPVLSRSTRIASEGGKCSSPGLRSIRPR
jgi:hypothetical protein